MSHAALANQTIHAMLGGMAPLRELVSQSGFADVCAAARV